MNFDRFTVKAREAIADAQNLAGKYGNPEIRPHHLLMVLLTQEKGVATSLLSQVGADTQGLTRSVAQALDELPKVHGGAKANVSRQFQQVLDIADKEARALGDTHVAADLMLVAICDVQDKTKQVLADYGVTRERVLNALQVIRKGQKVQGEEAENQYEALKKYTRDMTQQAREGKLDPVVGRDEEIRRMNWQVRTTFLIRSSGSRNQTEPSLRSRQETSLDLVPCE